MSDTPSPSGPQHPEEGMWEATRFEVGAPWPWEPEWVEERGFRWLPDSGLLLLVEDKVTQQMCDDLAGPADFALVAAGPLVGFLARFGGNWGWAETMAWRRPGQGIPERLTPDGSPAPHAMLYPVLVDVRTKMVRHMRACTVSAHFTRVLYREVADRWSKGATVEEAQAAFAEFERRYPTINSALKGSLARSHGGD